MSNFERREFLQAVALFAGMRALKRWALFVPGAVEEDPVAQFTPGWLEKRNPGRPAFIKPEMGGHSEYLHYMSVNDPLLKGILIQAFSDISKPSSGPRPSLSHVFRKHLGYAQTALPSTAPLAEVLHVAFFTFAAVHSNFFKIKEIRHTFRVPLEYKVGEEEKYFYIGEFEKNIPVVFSEDTGQEKGIDKSFHFGNFAFLAHQYWYAKMWGLEEARRVPNLARVFANSAGSPDKNAERLATLGQYVWETFETLDWIDEMISTRRIIWPPATGYFDPDVSNDFRANLLGRIFALRLVGDPLTQEEVHSAIDILDTPDLIVPKVG